MKKMRNILKISILTLLCAAMLCSCASKVGSFHVNKKVVCEVGGEPITYDEYKFFFYRNYSEQSAYTGKDYSTPEGFEEIKAQTESQLKRRQFIMSLCDKYDIKLSKADKQWINDYVQSNIDEQGSEEKYNEWLIENRLTGDVFREMNELTFFYDKYLREVLITGIDKAIDMTPSAVIADFTDEKFYRYTQVYIPLTGHIQSDLAAKLKIDEAYAMLENGADFVDVAIQYSSKDKTYNAWSDELIRNGSHAVKGEKESVLESTVYGLEKGEYSKVFASSEGYHIVKRLELDGEYPSKSYSTLEAQSFANRYHEYIRTESEKVKIEYSKYFDSVDFVMLTRKEELK